MPYPLKVVGLPVVILLQSRFGISLAVRVSHVGAVAALLEPTILKNFLVEVVLFAI